MRLIAVLLTILAPVALAEDVLSPPPDIIPREYLQELDEVVVIGTRGELNVYVFIDEAKICFIPRGWESTHCFNALVGKDTLPGEYNLKRYRIMVPAYGGDILAYRENATSIWSIHRVISVPGQNRLKRITSDKIKNRIGVTAGCINVMPDVFDLLVDCCSNSRIKITTMRAPGG